MNNIEALELALSILRDQKGRGFYRTRQGVQHRWSETQEAITCLENVLRHERKNADPFDGADDEFTNLPEGGCDFCKGGLDLERSIPRAACPVCHRMTIPEVH